MQAIGGKILKDSCTYTLQTPGIQVSFAKTQTIMHF